VRDYDTRLAQVCSRLNAEEARYLVVGASAMQLWGTTRATRDIDILIEPTEDNAARVLAALSQLGFGIASEFTPKDVITRVVTMIGDIPNVDILTRAWNVQWSEANPRATPFEVALERKATTMPKTILNWNMPASLPRCAGVAISLMYKGATTVDTPMPMPPISRARTNICTFHAKPQPTAETI
jgi:hypothetical protein